MTRSNPGPVSGSQPTPTRRLRLPTIAATAALLLAALLLVACGEAAVPVPPTRTPAPTFTPTPLTEQAPVDPAALATAQAAPPVAPAVPNTTTVSGDQPPSVAPVQSTSVFSDVAAAPTTAPAAAPTNTPAPANPQVVLTQIVNVRGGPGTTYNVLGAGNQGQTFRVTGKNAAGDWWQIDYNGQAGWVFGELVTPQNTEAVAVAANIPPAPTAAPAPPATNTPVPAPAQPPAEQPPAEQPTAAPAPAQPDTSNLPFTLGTTERCDPNPGTTYFNGYTRDANNNLINAVCIHIAYYEPRVTKCSGCDGVGDGNWGFAPFGGPAPRGVTVEIFVVECPTSLPMGGVTSGFGNLTPQSPKWVRTINDSEQCTGITFYRK